MINFDGAILMDIMSMSGPPIRLLDGAACTPDGVDIYKYERIPEDNEDVCEGCGYWREERMISSDLRPLYRSYALTPESYDTMAPVLTYCQDCMEDMKNSYDEDPMAISAHGSIPGAPWWQPVFVSGHAYGAWQEFK